MLNRFRLALRTVFLRGRLDREMQEEMEAHLERSAVRLQERGLSEREAQRAARREFGNVDSLQEQARDARGGRWLESIVADLRFGLRHFGRTPFSTLLMIVLLALGIGFNSALFTVIYSLVNMPPAGIARHESLMRIRGLERQNGRTAGREFSYAEFRAYAAQRALFSAVAAWNAADVVLAVGEQQENLQSGAATYITGDYFQVLGVRPVLGELLPPATRTDGGPPVLLGVISHTLWERFYGRSSAVLGRTLTVNDVAVAIVGVAPPHFAGARTGGSQVRVWLPLNARPLVQRTTAGLLASYDSTVFSLVARLQPGVAREQANPPVAAIAARLAEQNTRWRTSSGISAELVTLLADNYFPPSGEPPSWVGRITTLLIPLLILLIPCTSVSVLLVGLAIARRREIAVRFSLGAARGRIVRQLVTESVLLALAAGALGLGLIWLLLNVFDVRVPDLQLVMHWPALAFTFAIAIATGMLFGVAPALNATRVSVSEVLKNSAGAVASGRSRLQSALVVAQIALTQPLLLGLGALILGLLADLERMPAPAFDDRILQVSFYLNTRSNTTEQQREEQLRRLERRLAALPGVEAVVAQGQSSGYARVAVHPSDRVPGVDYDESFGVNARGAPAGFFSLMGFPFVRGAEFDYRAPADSRAVVIRSDLARRLWGNADPIGRRLVHAGSGGEGTAFVVVGVVDAARAGQSGEQEVHVFVPTVTTTGSLLIRTHGPAQPMMQLVRSVAHTEAPTLPITRMTTLAALDASQRTLIRRLSAAALGGGTVALFLSAIGLYAIIAFAVGQRTREIGIRTALGADPRTVVGLFFYRGVRLSLLGLAIGLAMSAAFIRIVTTLEGRTAESGTFLLGLLVAPVVVGVASLASWIPARRAARVDPLTMLRTE